MSSPHFFPNRLLALPEHSSASKSKVIPAALLPNVASVSVVKQKTKKKRKSYSRGEMNAMAKLKEEDVKTIKEFLRDSEYMSQQGTKTNAYQDLSKAFNVTPSCIMQISCGYTWTWVK